MCFDIIGLNGATLSGFVESRQQVATASGYSTNILIYKMSNNNLNHHYHQILRQATQTTHANLAPAVATPSLMADPAFCQASE